VDSIYDIVWARDPQSGREVKYRDVRYQDEYEFSVFNFEVANTENLWKMFDRYEQECKSLVTVRFAHTVNDGVVNWNWSDFVVETKKGHIRVGGGEVDTRLLPGEEFADFQPTYNVRDCKVEFLRDREIREEHVPLTYSPIRVMPLHASAETLVSLYPLPLPAFDLCLKCSHIFNLLDARGAISVTERMGMIARVRYLAVKVAEAYLKTQAVNQLAGVGGRNA
jgi:glycyl-tRNA synthetase alpha chain